MHTEWPRPTGCLKLQVIFRKRATNDTALLWKMTYEDTASCGSTPPCTEGSSVCLSVYASICLCACVTVQLCVPVCACSLFGCTWIYSCACVCVHLYAHVQFFDLFHFNKLRLCKIIFCQNFWKKMRLCVEMHTNTRKHNAANYYWISCVCITVFMYAYTHASTYTYTCLYIYIYIYRHACIHIFISVCTSIYNRRAQKDDIRAQQIGNWFEIRRGSARKENWGEE